MPAVPEPPIPDPALVSDATLMARVAQRDSRALIELERRHRSSLYAQVYGILMDSTSAERVVRDVFSQLWYTAGWVGSKGTTWSWLRDMATELARAERALREAPIPWR